jgi:formylglycine-generating enzyme required for sulfatase activity
MARSPLPSYPKSPIKVFFSYSRKDQDLRDELERYLSPLVRLKKIEIWHDRKIPGGTEWQAEIDHHIQTAEIILLLISPNFVHSQFCYEIELPIAMDRHDAKNVLVFPILLSPTPFWQELPFAKLQIYPSDSNPINKWSSEADAFQDIVKGIVNTVDTLLAQHQQHQQDLETWLAQLPLPLSVEHQPELARRQKLAKMSDSEISEKILEIIAQRQEQARLEEQQQQAEQTRQEQECLRKQQLREAIERFQPITVEVMKSENDGRIFLLDRQNHSPGVQVIRDAKVEEAIRNGMTIEEAICRLDRYGFFYCSRQAIRDTKIIEEAIRNGMTIKEAIGNAMQIEVAKFGSGVRIPIEFVPIPSGKFWMGSPNGEGDNYEKPRREVTLAPFYMSKFPITQAQYQAVMDKNPSHFKGENRPVESVSHFDAWGFCRNLSMLCVYEVSLKENLQIKIDLPSEAQWEYACRAGTETPFYFGDTISTEQVNYNGTYTYGSGKKGIYRGQTTDVGTFPPNSFGLYDMHGNVLEWCLDRRHDYQDAPVDGRAWYRGEKGYDSYHSLRGGSWSSSPWDCRSAARNSYNPNNHYSNFGFRVVLSVMRA